MASSGYVKGRRFEYRVRDYFYKQGAVYVMRAAQSKGIADLAVLWPPVKGYGPDVELVQCKYGSARMSKADKAELVDLATRTGADAVLAEPGENGRGVKLTYLTNE